jgi:hypothetical protein
MSALIDCLDRLTGELLGTVVHINPSLPEVIERYAALGAQRVALVGIDPDMLPLLQHGAAGRPGFEVIEAAVAAAPGPAQWLRYNVPTLSGLLQPTGLKQFYPRLQLLERVPVNTVTLQALIEQLRITVPSERLNLLVLEAPGLDAPMLEGLSDQVLGLFSLVLVRGTREDLYLGGVVAGVAAARLQRNHYRSVHESGSTEPLWPVTLLRHDTAAADRAVLLARLETLQAQLQVVTNERDESQRRAESLQSRAKLREGELQTQVDTLNQAKAAADKTATERDTQLQQLTQSKAAVDKQLQERQGQLDALGQAKTASEKTATECAAQIEQLTRARDEQAKRATERETQVQQLTQAKATVDKQLQERQAQFDALGQAKVSMDKTAAERAAQIEQLGKARDEYSRQANERQKRVVQLDAELTDLSARYAMLQEELIKAEAHVELISDLLLREPA